jgi:hypothetical protein
MKLVIPAMILLTAPIRADEVGSALSNPAYSWSAETNSLRLGIICPNRTIAIRLSGAVITDADFALLNESTNSITFFPARELEQRFELSLVDRNGIAVPKTSKGKAMGKPLDEPPNKPQAKAPDRPQWDSHEWLGRDYRIRTHIPPRSEWSYSLRGFFDLGRSISKMFEIEKPGEYKLTMAERMYVVKQGDSKTLLPVTFPPITLNVKVEK